VNIDLRCGRDRREDQYLSSVGKVNRGCVPEIKETVKLFSSQVVKALADHYGNNLVSVCLFGSASRGALRKGSDIDYLVVVKEALRSYHKRIKDIMLLLGNLRETKEYRRLELLSMDIEPSFLILTSEETERHPSILLDISYEGILLYDENNFLLSHFEQIHNTLKGLGSLRKNTPHGHYWVLKPAIKRGEVVKI